MSISDMSRFETSVVVVVCSDFNVAFNNFSVISRRLVATGSSYNAASLKYRAPDT